MNHVDAKVLTELKNLSGIPAARLESLSHNLTVKAFRKNERIFGQGEKAKVVYLLLAGVITVSYNNHDQQTIVSLLPSGEFFGFDALVPESRHAFSCTAFEASTIGSIKPRLFVEIVLGSSYETFLPGFAATLHLHRQSYVRCIRGIALDLRRRIALELMNLADHFGEANPRGTLITLAISHETLAEIVGASRQQVTEYLNVFDREGLILREGRRIIVNARGLRKIIESRP